MKMKTPPGTLPCTLTLLLVIATGCSHLPRQHQRTRQLLHEESRALTTAVVDALTLQPEKDRDPFSDIALQFARQDQRLEGFPRKPFDLPALLPITNAFHPLIPAEPSDEARAEVQQRFALQEQLRKKAFAISEDLQQRGLAHLQERNRLRTLWAKRAGWIGLPIVGLVLIAVFCPAALPIVGRLLAWLVGKVPALSGALGVVSVKAFDAIVRGIERAKADSPPPPRDLANHQALGPHENNPNSWPETLHNQLSREMDAAHKCLVRQRKQVIAHTK